MVDKVQTLAELQARLNIPQQIQDTGLRGDIPVQLIRDLLASLEPGSGSDLEVGGGGAVAGQWERISSVTASAQTNIDITLPTGYDAYRIRMIGVRSSLSDDHIVLRVENSTEVVVTSEYRYRTQTLHGAGASPVVDEEGFDNVWLGLTTTLAGAGHGIAAGENFSGVVEIDSARDSALFTTIRSVIAGIDSAGEDAAHYMMGGFYNQTTVVIGVRFTMFTGFSQSVGTIDTGRFILEGLKT